MECTRLGRTGLKVSRLCLGTMNFGPNTGEKEAFAIMDRALEAGINFFDTANMYGMRGTGHRGLTEEIIGRWFAQGGGRREKVVLATKVFADMMDENDGPNGAPGLSAYKIRRHLEGSLRRLGTDHIELYYMHEWDPHCTWTELWEVFGALAARGDIFYVGASNFSAWQLAIAQAEADRRGLLGIVCSEHKFNLMRRLPELELHPLCRRLGIGAATWSPLNMGLLSGALSRPMDKNQRSAKFAGALSEEQLAQQKAYTALCAGLGATEADVATAWLLQNPDVTAPIIGPRTVAQLKDALGAAELTLPRDFLVELDRLFPGPGGEAPEAYKA